MMLMMLLMMMLLMMILICCFFRALDELIRLPVVMMPSRQHEYYLYLLHCSYEYPTTMMHDPKMIVLSSSWKSSWCDSFFVPLLWEAVVETTLLESAASAIVAGVDVAVFAGRSQQIAAAAGIPARQNYLISAADALDIAARQK